MMTFSLLKDEGVRLRTKSSSVLLGAAIVCLVGWSSSPARTLWTIFLLGRGPNDRFHWLPIEY